MVFNHISRLSREIPGMDDLLDKLREAYGSPPAARRRNVIFLAHKDKIAEALRAGWTIKQVWAQITKGDANVISYTHFCRLVKDHITSPPNDVHGEVPPAAASSLTSSQSEKQVNAPAKNSDVSEHASTEKERLDLLKEQTFKAVRAPKSTGPLIGKPKTREEEDRELFRE